MDKQQKQQTRLLVAKANVFRYTNLVKRADDRIRNTQDAPRLNKKWKKNRARNGRKLKKAEKQVRKYS